MARALEGSGLAVYAVELPGHDVAAGSEPFAPIARVAEDVVAEITGLGATRVMLWAHSSGAALGIETARRLQERDVAVERVFLGAQLLGDASDRWANVTELTGRNDSEIAAALTVAGGYTELGDLDTQRAEHVGSAYRHDCVSAHGYFADALERPPAIRLVAPVAVVVAADDASTAGFESRYRDWQLFFEHVELHELASGGHYFLRTRPADAAQIVREATEPSVPR
jgi:surfactin synthase thioesterase subunit